tara:strand:- start:736 stop:972 length:237 start_codon:yes stop_codon:yes gene_type:complete
MEKRKYVGRLDVKETKYGEIIKVSLGPLDFQLLQDERNEKGWVMFDLKRSKEGGYYGEIATQFKPQTEAANTATDDLF